MERRDFLGGLAALSALALAGCSTSISEGGALHTIALIPSPTLTVPPTPAPTFTPTPMPTPTPTPFQTAPVLQRVARPHKVIGGLPGKGNLMAWTVDDGRSTEVVAAYAKFAKDTGTRLTFFVNGIYGSWTDNAAALRPLIDSGQVQMANHTFSHADLTKQSDSGIIDQLQRNGAFIKNTFGVDAAPYFRPPYGYIDARVQNVAASIGYTTPVMWYGSLGDAALLSPTEILKQARKWFLPQHIVIGHANNRPVIQAFSRLLDILDQRGLQTVTLDDVFVR